MSAVAGDAFGAALRDGRADFNRRFEQARHRFPQLAGSEVLDFLRDNVAPAAGAVHVLDDGALFPFVSAAYDAVLLLCGQRLGGSSGRHAVIGQAWRRLLPAAAPLAAREPARLLAAISNATHALVSTPGASPDEWLDAMEAVAPRCADVATLLKCGQVAAWRAGLAHLRAGALAVTRALPPELAAAALGVRDVASLAPALQKLETDRWFDPRSGAAPGLRVVRAVGAFRGWGGLFLVPPRVAAADDGWLIESGDQYWYLVADAFGATFHRATGDEWRAAQAAAAPLRGASLVGAQLRQGASEITLPLAGPVSSIVASGGTLAFTSQHTFAVTLVALA